ncbi:MAG: acyltransferase family protein [Planctomycetota bacterium]
MSKKIAVLKPLLIVLVILNHYTIIIETNPSTRNSFAHLLNGYVQTFISYGMAGIVVPLFFLMSGYLFFRNFVASKEFFINKIKTRIKTVLIPYLLCVLLHLLFYYFLQKFSVVSLSSGNYTNYTLIELIDRLFIHPIAGQLWFIRDLFIFVVLSPVIYWLLSRIGPAFLGVIASIWFLIVFDAGISRDIEGFLYFSLGGFFSLNSVNIKFSVRRPIFILLLWLGIISIRTYYVANLNIMVNELDKLSVIAGVAAVWLNYDMINRICGRLLSFLVAYSFPIYLYHLPVVQLCRGVTKNIATGSGLFLLITYFIFPLLAMIICVGVAYLLRETMPKFYDIITGGRGYKRQ